MFLGLQRAIATRWAVATVIAVIMALAATSIATGFLTDDHSFRAAVRSTNVRAPAPYDLFKFATDSETNQLRVRVGHLPWWSAPELKIHFLRPLTGLLFAADVRVFDDAPLGYHLHSLVWYLALLVGAAVMFRRLLPPAAATIALAVFGFAAAHVEAYAWVSARHVATAGAFAAAVLAVRGGPGWWRRGIAFVLLIFALLSSEAGLAVVPLWVAFELAEDRPWRARIVACVPAVALALAYLVVYSALGFGTRASGGYHDPAADPIGFLGLVVLRVPILLGDAALGIPAELAHVIAESHLAVIGMVAVGVVALAVWLTAPRKATTPGSGASGARVGHATAASSGARVGNAVTPSSGHGGTAAPAAAPSWRAIGWWVVGGVIATIPGAAGYPAGRVLVIPDLAFAAVIGLVIYRGVFGVQVGVAGRLLAGVLAIVHLVVAPIATGRAIGKLVRRTEATEAIAREAIGLAPASGRLFVIGASDPLVFLYPRGIATDLAPGAIRCWSVMSAAHSAQRVTRNDVHTLTIEALDRPLLAGSFDQLFRAPERPFEVGDEVEQCGATYRVVAVKDGKPSKVEVHLRRSFDDPEIGVIEWRGDGFARFALPKVGDSVELPWRAGPSGAL